MKRCLFNEMVEGFGCLERRRHRIYWHAKNHHLIATKGAIVVQEFVPVDYSYTDARLWRKLFEAKIDRCKDRLRRAEACESEKVQPIINKW